MPGKINVAKCPISETVKDLVDGGPCNPLQMLHASQIILLAFFGISCLGSLLAGLFKLGKYLKYRNCEGSNRLIEFCWKTTQLGIIFFYIVLCDTGKVGWITESSFSLTRYAKLFGVFLLLGLLTVRKNSKASLLDVNVTTEIKGWMQIGILVYHYTDAYYVLPIFIVIRLFVSMYVVLSAYGHFCYYWRKNNLQEEEMLKLPVCRRVCICLKSLLYRYIQVLFRMNFLVILLCPIFQQPYMKYYFVPLITTAYTLSAGTMTAWMFLLFLVELTCCHRPKGASIPASELPVMVWLKAAREFVEKHRKDICFLLVLSLAGLYSLLLNTSTSLFSYTFCRRPLIYLFGPENGQWRYRWSIDSYSTVLGLALGYAVSKLKELRQRKEGDAIPLETDGGTSAGHFRIPRLIMSCLIAAGSGVILLTYIVLGVRSAGSHKKYTNLHPYTMSVGILAILVLRNSSGILRRYYSKFFLWVGRFALELFVLQYHMWITAPNGRGVITFIPTYTSLNFVLTTTLFFVCCWRVHEITQWLTSFLMP